MMKKIYAKTLAIVCFLVLTISFSFVGGNYHNITNAKSNDFDCEYSVGDKTDPYTSNIYGATQIITYTEQQAIDANIPSGFTGDVLEVVSDVTNRGVTLDFSADKIPIYYVKSITFRVYVGDDEIPTDGYPEVRIPKPKESGGWVMRSQFANRTNSWQEIVLEEGNGTIFANNSGQTNFTHLSKDGYLNKFELSVRHNGTNEPPFYIDFVKIKLIDNDGVAPVISYSGEEVVTISQGQRLDFTVKAIDALEGEVAVDYVWGDPTKIESDGTPMVGEHTLTFVAKDFWGNTATKEIKVIVNEPDLNPPEFTIPCDTMYAKIGTKVVLTFVANDDINGQVSVVQTWSEGAIDKRGRLTEGTHVLTLTATDLSGNETVKTITFIVTENGDVSDRVIDEDELTQNSEEGSEEENDKNSSDFTTDRESESTSQSMQDSTSNSNWISTSKGSKKGCKGEIGGVMGISLLAVYAVALIRKKK